MIKDTRKEIRRTARARRIRAKVAGTAKRPRVAVFRSLRQISVQAIDDQAGATLCAVRLGDLGAKAKNRVAEATKLGGLLAERLAKIGVTEAVLDRAGYRYHGKVKALAEGAREKGLKI